jgi:hypothetical protein
VSTVSTTVRTRVTLRSIAIASALRAFAALGAVTISTTFIALRTVTIGGAFVAVAILGASTTGRLFARGPVGAALIASTASGTGFAVAGARGTVIRTPATLGRFALVCTESAVPFTAGTAATLRCGLDVFVATACGRFIEIRHDAFRVIRR